MAFLNINRSQNSSSAPVPAPRVGARSSGSAGPAEGSLSKLELEWKGRIHSRLLEVIDLSLIGTLGDDQARIQIREISQRLMTEESAPLNVEQRKRVIQRIEDEVLGLGPLEPLLQDPTISDILVNGARRSTSSAAASYSSPTCASTTISTC